MAATSIILAIDTGSSSIRCTAYELLAKDCSSDGSSPIKGIGICHSITFSCITPSTGHIRIHEVLLSIDQCIDNVLSSLRPSFSSYHIVAVGFSTFVMNLVGVDEMGEPVGEDATCSYACNRRDVVEECQNLKLGMTAEELQSIYQKTGAPLHSAYGLPQLLAFYNNCVHNRSRVHKWQSISSICIHRWMGGGEIVMPISYSEASWTGLLDFRTCTWNETLLNILNDSTAIKSCGGILKLLPKLTDIDGTSTNDSFIVFSSGLPSHNSNGVKNPYWERWPELRRTNNYYDKEDRQLCRFFLGIGDGAAANFGSKCDAYSTSETFQRIAVTIGTSAAARVCLPLAIEATPTNSMDVPFGLFCYRADKSRILVGGALTDGGSVIEWARGLLNLQFAEDFDSALEQISDQYFNNSNDIDLESSRSVNTVTMIPFLSGERSTGFRGSASACISGITRDTTAIDILHGAFQGVTLRLGACIHLITQMCRKNQQDQSTEDRSQTTLVVSGNALERNYLWRQMIADCTGYSVIVDGDSSEGTSRGVAMLIARTIRQDDQYEERLSIVSESRPSPDTKRTWEHATRDQEKLISAVSATWTW